jgi:hypothetical protein
MIKARHLRRAANQFPYVESPFGDYHRHAAALQHGFTLRNDFRRTRQDRVGKRHPEQLSVRREEYRKSDSFDFGEHQMVPFARSASPRLTGDAVIRHRDQVEFGQRISDAEIFIVVAEETNSRVERVAAMLALAWSPAASTKR